MSSRHEIGSHRTSRREDTGSDSRQRDRNSSQKDREHDDDEHDTKRLSRHDRYRENDRSKDRRSREGRRRSASPSGESSAHSRRNRGDENPSTEEYQYGKRNEVELETNKEDVEAGPPAEKPNFGLSGALAADVNSYRGIVLKYSEPPEARNPTEKYRIYVFKGDEQVDVLHIHRQSAYLIGRERLVADIPIDHPSCSKQHAALQYRQVTSKNEFGDISREVKLYIVDLESANGTFVNGKKIPPTRYYELRVGDVVKFGSSTRDYVLMSESVAE